MMHVVVIGLGSMGKRRIRLIKELYPESVVCGVDEREDRRNDIKTLYGISAYAALSDVKEKVEYAFVCTSPLSHAPIVGECLNRGWHVFTELNLVADKYDENVKLAKEKGCVLFLSSTFLYRDEIKYISSKIVNEKKWNYIYHIGQYLPDWHPWESYKDFFIGNSITNGCREIMAIELPWITRAFGMIESVNSISDKMTELKIGYNDNYIVTINHENGNKGIIVVDVVSPVAVRKLEVYSENGYLSWNGTPETVYEYNLNKKTVERIKLKEEGEHVEGYSQFIVENAYKNEIKEFINTVQNGKKLLYSFEEDKKILEIIDSIGA